MASNLKTEEDVLKYWEHIQAFQKSIENNKDCPEFIFYDGPPFATGLPHYGHIVASTLKDIFPRYKTQMGFKVERRFGFDTHGLPIEYEIEKKLGIKTKEEVEAFGIDKYNEECRKIVLTYRKEWRSTITRLGRWVDFDNDYKTMDPSYMESVWWVFSELWKKGLVYQGAKVMPYSTGCHTPLSNFEAKSNYKEVKDPSIVVKIPLLNATFPNIDGSEVPTYLLVWTTTPWTLLSNLAVCANPDMIYVCICVDVPKPAYYILSKSSLETYFKGQQYTIISSFAGSIMTKYRYQPLYNFFQNVASESEKAFMVLNDTYVKEGGGDNGDDTEGISGAGGAGGTGLVHQAPAFGEDDYRVCLANGIVNRHRVPPCPIDDNGNFTSDVGEFSGLYFKNADPLIIADLKKRNLLFQKKEEVHKYPYCWRSDTPLIYKNVTCWFIDVKSIGDKLVSHNESVNWSPESIGKSKFRNWLENVQDWCVSRDRYWGTPLPIWVSDDGEEKVCIGSIKELEELAQLPPGSVTDLHSHCIDHITIPSKTGKGILHRVKQVMDCWMDSAAMPYAQAHYPFENKENFEKNFPCDFIAEGTDQTRGWFYTLLVLSTALFDKPAYKNVLVNGLVLAEDGEKMSKRKQNYTAPEIIIDKYGADALRLYLIDSRVVKADTLKFQDSGVKSMVKDIHIMVNNMIQYRTETIANYEVQTGTKWHPIRVLSLNDAGYASLENPIDSWMLHCLEEHLHHLHADMDKYELGQICTQMRIFIDRLSRWYIKLNKTRFRLPKNPGTEQAHDVRIGLSVLEYCLHYFSLAMAPFAPFLAEIVFHNTLVHMQSVLFLDQTKQQSVHFNTIPRNIWFHRNDGMVTSMEYMTKVVNMIRQQRTHRQTYNTAVKTSPSSTKLPYRKAVFIHSDPKVLEALKRVEEVLTSETNILECEYETGPEQYLHFTLVPNYKLVGKKVGKHMQQFRAFLENLTDYQVEYIMNGQRVIVMGDDDFMTIDATNVAPGQNPIVVADLVVNSVLQEESKTWQISYDSEFIMILDPTVTSDLEDVYYLKYLSRKVQNFRRSIGLQLSDQVLINYNCDPNNSLYTPEFFTKHQESLSHFVGEFTPNLPDQATKDYTFTYEDETVLLQLALK